MCNEKDLLLQRPARHFRRVLVPRKDAIRLGIRPRIPVKSDAWVSDPEFISEVTPGSHTQNSFEKVTPGYKIFMKEFKRKEDDFLSKRTYISISYLLKLRLVLGGTCKNDGTNSHEGDRLGLVSVTVGNPK